MSRSEYPAIHRLRVGLAAAGAAAALIGGAALPAAASNPHDVLRSSLAPSLPTDPVIRGVAPGGAPWVIDRGEVRVRDDGRIDLRVEGLVIPPLDFTNPVPTLSASVSCEGQPFATTGTVPFSPEGDATLRDWVELPEPCLAPIVFIHPNAVTTVYIAISGG